MKLTKLAPALIATSFGCFVTGLGLDELGVTANLELWMILSSLLLLCGMVFAFLSLR
jgi:uncharacterized membrane protein